MFGPNAEQLEVGRTWLCTVVHCLQKTIVGIFWASGTLSIFKKTKKKTQTCCTAAATSSARCCCAPPGWTPPPSSPSPTRVLRWLSTFSETVVTFDPCQATMCLGHVVEQARSYLSVSRALAQGRPSSPRQGGGRRALQPRRSRAIG